MVGMELSCRDNLFLKLISTDELPLPETTRLPLQWNVTVKSGAKFGVIPDAVFALQWLHTSDQQNDTLYFVEADRGTMPITRRNPKQSSFFRKLLAYQQSWTQGVVQERFGQRRFRVLTITSTKQRREHLMQACAELKTGKGLFLFTDQETLRATPNTLLLPWFTADGAIETLAEPAPVRARAT